MKKKLLVIGLCVTLALTATACSVSKKDGGKNSAGTVKEVETNESGEYMAAKTASVIDSDDFTYKELKVGKSSETVDESTLNDAIDKILSNHSTTEESKEGTVKDGDTVNIDYVGKLDGNEFEGGTASGYDLTIGSGSFIPGFESGLIDKNIGDTVTLDLTFPDTYTQETTVNGESVSLAGKPVQFTVTINSVKVTKTPELTDEFVAEYCKEDCDGAQTVAELKDYVSNQLVLSNKISKIWPTLLDNTEIKYDAAEEQTKYTDVYKYYENIITSNYGVTVDEYLKNNENTSKEDFESSLHDEAQYQLKCQVISNYIARAENITATQEEYDERAKSDMDYYGYKTIEEYEKTYPKQETIDQIIYYKVLEFIAENAKVVDDSELETTTDGTATTPEEITTEETSAEETSEAAE